MLNYGNIEVAQQAMRTLERITEIENHINNKSNVVISVDGSSITKIDVPSTKQDTHQGSNAKNMLVTRMNTGNYAIRNSILNGLKELKKEPRTYLHDIGVSIELETR